MRILLSKVSSCDFKECLKIAFNAVFKYTKIEKSENGPVDPVLRGLFSLALLIVQSMPSNATETQNSFSPEFCDDV